jgi:hypothetical protein
MADKWEVRFIDTQHYYPEPRAKDEAAPPDIPEGWEPFGMSTTNLNFGVGVICVTRVAVRRRKET